MQIVSIDDSLHKISNLYPEKNNKNISKCHLVNILPRCLALICIIKLQIQEVGKETFWWTKNVLFGGQ